MTDNVPSGQPWATMLTRVLKGNWAGPLSLVTGLGVLLAIMMTMTIGPLDRGDTWQLRYEIRDLDARTRDIQRRVEGLATLTKASPGNAQLLATISQVETDMNKLKEWVSAFEVALSEDPVKKLAVPMLRKDIDNLKVTTTSSLAAVRDEANRSVELIKWLLGILGATNVGTGLLSFLRPR